MYFLTSNYAFAEAVNVLARYLGRETALDFISQIKSGNIEMLFVNEVIEAEVIEFFKKQ